MIQFSYVSTDANGCVYNAHSKNTLCFGRKDVKRWTFSHSKTENLLFCSDLYDFMSF